MTPEEERAYILGQEMMAVSLMNSIQRQYLPKPSIHEWNDERIRTIHILRELCKVIGDNNWEDILYIPDIIEKHILKHIL